MRVVALLATYNEERFIAASLEHLIHQGVEVYVIDNGSTDATVQIADRYADRGLIGRETITHDGYYRWRSILARKEELATTIEADWFLHVDPDEVRLSPAPGVTLAEALAEVERRGFNAVNFHEFTFVPTTEEPDHDHPSYERTMRWYYPFLPGAHHQLKAWKRQSTRVELVGSGGHTVTFPGIRVYPELFPMRHYLFLSEAHAVRKFIERRYDPDELAAGHHAQRAALGRDGIRLQSRDELRLFVSDDRLDPTGALDRHPLFAATPVSSAG